MSSRCRGLRTDSRSLGGGFAVGPFHLEGFLPAKAAARRSRLEALKAEPRTLIFYEAPHRILESLGDFEDVFGGERMAVLGRELTKTFETLKGLPLGALRAWVEADSNQQRGECVLLVEGWQAPQGESAVSAEALRVLDLLLAEMPLKRCCRRRRHHWRAQESAVSGGARA